MAGGQVDLSAVNAFTLEVYPHGSEFWVQFERTRPLLELILTSGRIPFNGRISSDGRYLVFPFVVGELPDAAVPYGEGGALAQPSTVDRSTARFNLRHLNQALRLTGTVMDTMTGTPYTIADEIEFQMTQHREAAQKEMNWMMHQDGSGLRATLATAAAVAGGSTITVDTTERIKEGMNLDIRNKATGSLLPQDAGGPTYTRVKVSNVVSTTQFVVTMPNGENPDFTTLADGSAFGVYRAGAQGRALYGLANFTSDLNPQNHGAATTLGNIDRSVTANAFWQAGHRINAGSATISVISHVQLLLSRLNKVAGEFINNNRQLLPNGQAFRWYGFSGHDVHNTLGNALKADQRTAPNYVQLRGGFTGIEYNGLVLVVDNDADHTRLRVIHPGSLERYRNRDWSFDMKTGAMWNRAIDDGNLMDAFIAFMITRQAFVGTRMNTHGEIHTIGNANF